MYCHTTDHKQNIIFNGLTGAINIVDSSIAKALYENDLKAVVGLNVDVIDGLKKEGYLFDYQDEEDMLEEKIVELHLDSAASETSGENITYTFAPTLSCNLNCFYCFENKVANRSHRMSLNMLESALEYIGNNKIDNHKSRIELFGGEPLLNENYAINKRIFEFAKDNSIKVRIVTNGTLIKEQYKLLEDYKSNISMVAITLDGLNVSHDARRHNKKGEGTFDVIINNMELLLDLGVTVLCRVHVDKPRFPELRAIVDFLEAKFMAYSNFSYSFALITNREKTNSVNQEDLMTEDELAIELEQMGIKSNMITQNAFRILRYLKTILNEESTHLIPSLAFCGANSGGQVIFAPDGYLYNCSEAIGIEDLSIGTYHPEIKMFHEQLRRWEYTSVLKLDHCKSCAVALLCGGGCRLEKYYSSGAVDFTTSDFCDEQLRIINNYLDFYRKKMELL